MNRIPSSRSIWRLQSLTGRTSFIPRRHLGIGAKGNSVFSSHPIDTPTFYVTKAMRALWIAGHRLQSRLSGIHIHRSTTVTPRSQALQRYSKKFIPNQPPSWTLSHSFRRTRVVLSSQPPKNQNQPKQVTTPPSGGIAQSINPHQPPPPVDLQKITQVARQSMESLSKRLNVEKYRAQYPKLFNVLHSIGAASKVVYLFMAHIFRNVLGPNNTAILATLAIVFLVAYQNQNKLRRIIPHRRRYPYRKKLSKPFKFDPKVSVSTNDCQKAIDTAQRDLMLVHDHVQSMYQSYLMEREVMMSMIRGYLYIFNKAPVFEYTGGFHTFANDCIPQLRRYVKSIDRTTKALFKDVISLQDQYDEVISRFNTPEKDTSADPLYPYFYPIGPAGYTRNTEVMGALFDLRSSLETLCDNIDSWSSVIETIQPDIAEMYNGSFKDILRVIPEDFNHQDYDEFIQQLSLAANMRFQYRTDLFRGIPEDETTDTVHNAALVTTTKLGTNADRVKVFSFKLAKIEQQMEEQKRREAESEFYNQIFDENKTIREELQQNLVDFYKDSDAPLPEQLKRYLPVTLEEAGIDKTPSPPSSHHDNSASLNFPSIATHQPKSAAFFNAESSRAPQNAKSSVNKKTRPSELIDRPRTRRERTFDDDILSAYQSATSPGEHTMDMSPRDNPQNHPTTSKKTSAGKKAPPAGEAHNQYGPALSPDYDVEGTTDRDDDDDGNSIPFASLDESPYEIPYPRRRPKQNSNYNMQVGPGSRKLPPMPEHALKTKNLEKMEFLPPIPDKLFAQDPELAEHLSSIRESAHEAKARKEGRPPTSDHYGKPQFSSEMAKAALANAMGDAKDSFKGLLGQVGQLNEASKQRVAKKKKEPPQPPQRVGKFSSPAENVKRHLSPSAKRYKRHITSKPGMVPLSSLHTVPGSTQDFTEQDFQNIDKFKRDYDPFTPAGDGRPPSMRPEVALPMDAMAKIKDKRAPSFKRPAPGQQPPPGAPPRQQPLAPSPNQRSRGPPPPRSSSPPSSSGAAPPGRQQQSGHPRQQRPAQ